MSDVQTAQVNNAVLRRINREVSLRAARFANTLLAGVFRAIFRVEKAYEFVEPEVYRLDQAPDQILWSKLNAAQRADLPMAILKEEVLSARYQLFTEYDFVVVADVSQSMMFDWWPLYGGAMGLGGVRHEPRTWRVYGDRTKLFLLKYTLASFLHAAAANDFSCRVLLAGGGEVKSYDSRQQPNLEEFLLGQIDFHYQRLVARAAPERPRLCDALRQVLARRRRAIVLCLSDFMDGATYFGEKHPRVRLGDFILPLAEVSAHHRLLILQINDKLELEAEPEFNTLHAKNCPYLNGETAAGVQRVRVTPDALEQFSERGREWRDALGLAFRSFGIRYQRLTAGVDDERVDKQVCELGASTGD